MHLTMSSPIPPPKPPKSPKPPPPRPPPPPGPPPPPIARRPETPPPPESDEEEEPPPPSDEDESPPPSDDDESPPPSSLKAGGSVGSSSSKVFVGGTAGRAFQPSVRPHDSVRSTVSSIASISAKFRPESTWSQATGSTSVDQDEDTYDAAGYYAMYDNALMQNILSKMNRSGVFEKVVFVLTAEELIYIKLPTIKPNSKAATALATITGSSDSPIASKKETPEPSRSLPLSTVLAL